HQIFTSYSGSIACLQGGAVYGDLSTNGMHPGSAIFTETIGNGGPVRQLRHEEVSVLVDSGRPIAARRSGERLPFVLLFPRVKADLFVARLRAICGRLDPDLEEMHRIAFGPVVFTVHHSRAGGHPLNFVRSENLFMTHAVLVGERAL